MTAEAVARNYLDAGSTRGNAQAVIAAPPAAAPGAAAPPTAAPTAQLSAAPSTPANNNGTIINLIQLTTLPAGAEQKVLDAVRAVGGGDVTVRRILKGDVRDDARDTLVLEGRVPNQIALVRVLTLAAQLFTGQTIGADDIRVVADEAGALAGQTQSQAQSNNTSLGGGATSSLFGGARGNRLTNQVSTNFARATAVQAAGGRILSFIEVVDLPQVQIGRAHV